MTPAAEATMLQVKEIILSDAFGNEIPAECLNNFSFVDEVPTDYVLGQNYPNPFNPFTTIEYSLPATCHVRLEIYNQLGDLVETLVNKEQMTGNYRLQWRPQDLASGIYFYRLKTKNFTKVKKLIYLK